MKQLSNLKKGKTKYQISKKYSIKKNNEVQQSF